LIDISVDVSEMRDKMIPTGTQSLAQSKPHSPPTPKSDATMQQYTPGYMSPKGKFS
jgi:hypothetical protein